MKELYLNAEMEVVRFSVEDVIATSKSGGVEGAGGMGGPNEGSTTPYDPWA